jgi:hypothetical protein
MSIAPDRMNKISFRMRQRNMERSERDKIVGSAVAAMDQGRLVRHRILGCVASY